MQGQLRVAGRESSAERLISMLRTALGPNVGQLLTDDSVVELMLNPSGELWVDRLGTGREFSGHMLLPQDSLRIIQLVAGAVGATCNEENPILSAELPQAGSRFQGMIPPVVTSPSFTIRKKALMIFTLADYVAQGVMSEGQREAIVQAVQEKQNILVVGGTGSGKTTLANAILHEISRSNERIVLIEDTLELQCAAQDQVALRSREGVATMNDLLRAAMRLRPDRIVVGEVRGPEALALLKAWNTGHPGGVATVHADRASSALSRLEMLIQEAVVTVPRELIAEAVNIIVHIERANGRKVREVARVEGVKEGKYVLTQIG